MSKVLITGATGFIGSALASGLRSRGRDIVALGFDNGDISNKKTLESLLSENITYVFHLAGKTYVPDSWHDPVEFSRTNVLGTINVLEFCRRQNIPMTYVSAYLYGHPDVLPIREDATIRPSNPYALSKQLAEESCKFYANVHGMQVTTIRPFNVYGIGQADKFLIPTIIRQALEAHEINVKDIEPKRDFIYVDDLVEALLATMERRGIYDVYNIGSGVSFSVREVIDIIQNVAGTHKKIVCDNMVRPNELPNVIADISKASRELGWQPRFDFRAGIACIIHAQQKGNNQI